VTLATHPASGSDPKIAAASRWADARNSRYPKRVRRAAHTTLERLSRLPGAFPLVLCWRTSRPAASEESASRSAGRRQTRESGVEVVSRADPMADRPVPCGQARVSLPVGRIRRQSILRRESTAVRFLLLRFPRCGLPPPRRSAFAVSHDLDGLTFQAPSGVFQPVTFMGFWVLQQDPRQSRRTRRPRSSSPGVLRPRLRCRSNRSLPKQSCVRSVPASRVASP
jgi:hypothetical protein